MRFTIGSTRSPSRRCGSSRCFLRTDHDEDEIREILRSTSSAESSLVCVVCKAGWSESIQHAKDKWIPLVKECASSVPIMIVINFKSGTPKGEDDNAASEFQDTLDKYKVRDSDIDQQIIELDAFHLDSIAPNCGLRH